MDDLSDLQVDRVVRWLDVLAYALFAVIVVLVIALAVVGGKFW